MRRQRSYTQVSYTLFHRYTLGGGPVGRFKNSVRAHIVRSREISKPRDRDLEFSYRFEIW